LGFERPHIFTAYLKKGSCRSASSSSVDAARKFTGGFGTPRACKRARVSSLISLRVLASTLGIGAE
jgi:hypothetical protein